MKKRKQKIGHWCWNIILKICSLYTIGNTEKKPEILLKIFQILELIGLHQFVLVRDVTNNKPNDPLRGFVHRCNGLRIIDLLIFISN